MSRLAGASLFCALFASLVCISCAAKVEPISFPPDQNWLGFDGSWSTFSLGVGTPQQYVSVLPSTASQQSWVVWTDSCDLASDVETCKTLRGNVFNYNASSSWADVGNFYLWIEQNLGFQGYANYGYDDVTLGLLGQGGPTIDNVTVGAFAVLDFWLGIFGVNPKPTNFTGLGENSPSYLSKLKDEGYIPSLSFGYTAGARYRFRKSPGSLTLGGYDQARFAANDVLFSLADDNQRDLVVGLQSITTEKDFTTSTSSSNDTATSLLTGGIYAYIDSTVSGIYIPTSACQLFEEAFGLTYNETYGLYLLDDDTHNNLLAANPNVTLTLGIDTSGGSTVDIVLPYAAFDLVASPPFQNLTFSSYYFPLYRADDEGQYTLGRTFLQEAYLSVDWEAGLFNVSQCLWDQENPTPDIVAMQSNSTSHHSSSSLSGGAIGGIVAGAVVGVLALLALGLFLWQRRRKQRLAANLALHEKTTTESDDPTRPASSSDSSPQSQPDSTPSAKTPDLVFPKAELDASTPLSRNFPADVSEPGVATNSSQHDASSGCATPNDVSTSALRSRQQNASGSALGLRASPSNTAGNSSNQSPTTSSSSPAVWPVEIENREREVYEMPGDVPEISEMAAGGRLSEKEQAIRRERMYNGINPAEVPANREPTQ